MFLADTISPINAQTIFAAAACITATGSAVAAIITAIRTKGVDTKVNHIVDTNMAHYEKLSNVETVVEHTAESLDNHIRDEQPVIDAGKAALVDNERS